MTSRELTNYLCFTYDPAVAKDLGTAFSDELLTRLTRVGQVHYAIRPDGQGGWHLDREACFEALERFEREGSAFRMLGFPAHAWEVLLDYVRVRNRTLRFPLRSYALTGGGWKTLGDREIPAGLPLGGGPDPGIPGTPSATTEWSSTECPTPSARRVGCTSRSTRGSW